jgi:hypothetical protein
MWLNDREFGWASCALQETCRLRVKCHCPVFFFARADRSAGGTGYSFNFARIAGKADPVVSISQVNGNTDVHLTWYDTTPVPTRQSGRAGTR